MNAEKLAEVRRGGVLCLELQVMKRRWVVDTDVREEAALETVEKPSPVPQW